MFPTVMFPRSMFAQLDWWDAAVVGSTGTHPDPSKTTVTPTAGIPDPNYALVTPL